MHRRITLLTTKTSHGRSLTKYLYEKTLKNMQSKCFSLRYVELEDRAYASLETEPDDIVLVDYFLREDIKKIASYQSQYTYVGIISVNAFSRMSSCALRQQICRTFGLNPLEIAVYNNSEWSDLDYLQNEMRHLKIGRCA